VARIKGRSGEGGFPGTTRQTLRVADGGQGLGEVEVDQGGYLDGGVGFSTKQQGAVKRGVVGEKKMPSAPERKGGGKGWGGRGEAKGNQWVPNLSFARRGEKGYRGGRQPH